MNITQQLWSAKEWARVQASGSELVHLVHKATNEDKWGPTGAQMDEISRAFPRGGSEIMDELRWRLKSRDKAWRPCYKSLLVLDYLARNVADAYLPDICSLVPTLRIIVQSFYYTNPKGVDHGVSVRERAKNLADLMSDGLVLREERSKAAQTRRKLARNASDGSGPIHSGYEEDYPASRYGGGIGGEYPNRRSSPSHRSDYYSSSSSRRNRNNSNHYKNNDDSHNDNHNNGNDTVPRTREEQERLDMKLAARMQREEERRVGVRAIDIQNAYERQAHRSPSHLDRVSEYDEWSSPARRGKPENDEELARRLQEEEEERARRAGCSLPTLRSDDPSCRPTQQEKRKQENANVSNASMAPTVAASPLSATTGHANAASSSSSAAAGGENTTACNKISNDTLEDLFAPAPATAATNHTADPFNAFLQSREQQQQQQPHIFAQSMPPYATAPTPSLSMQSSAWTAAHDGGWTSGLPTTGVTTMPAQNQYPFMATTSASPGTGSSDDSNYTTNKQATGSANDFFGAAVSAPAQQPPTVSSSHDPWSSGLGMGGSNDSNAHAMNFSNGNHTSSSANAVSNMTQNMWATLSNFDTKQS